MGPGRAARQPGSVIGQREAHSAELGLCFEGPGREVGVVPAPGTWPVARPPRSPHQGQSSFAFGGGFAQGAWDPVPGVRTASG